MKKNNLFWFLIALCIDCCFVRCTVSCLYIVYDVTANPDTEIDVYCISNGLILSGLMLGGCS